MTDGYVFCNATNGGLASAERLHQVTSRSLRGELIWQQLHRKLTTHQKAVLIQVLLAFPDQRVGIFYSAAAEDGQTYAMDFMAIFKAIGWDVTGPEASEDVPGRN